MIINSSRVVPLTSAVKIAKPRLVCSLFVSDAAVPVPQNGQREDTYHTDPGQRWALLLALAGHRRYVQYYSDIYEGTARVRGTNIKREESNPLYP